MRDPQERTPEEGFREPLRLDPRPVVPLLSVQIPQIQDYDFHNFLNRQREKNRLNDLYHKLVNRIVELAGKYDGIALEDLTEIRGSIMYSAEMKGRLHRWSFRELQAKLRGR